MIPTIGRAIVISVAAINPNPTKKPTGIAPVKILLIISFIIFPSPKDER